MSSAESRVLKIELPTPYPVGTINSYFIDGSEPILIDTGVFSSRSINVLKERLQSNGRKLEEIRRILITHDHYDHAGAALRLSQEYGATLFLHEKSELLTQSQPEAMKQLFAFLLRCGVPRDLLEDAFRLFGMGDKFANFTAKPHAIERLKGGDSIAIDGGSLKALATPGHSPEHLCFFDAARRVLFCGDLLLPNITPNPLLHLDPKNAWRRTPSLLHYLESLDLIETIDVALGCPGHGPNIDDVAGLIAKNKSFIVRRKTRMREEITKGFSVPYELARAVFGELDLANQYLAISETVAYLDLLEREEKISVNWDGDPIRFAPR